MNNEVCSILEELHQYKATVEDIVDNGVDVPIDISDIPNKQGINLNSVKDVEWEKQDNGELTYVKVNYEPENPERKVIEALDKEWSYNFFTKFLDKLNNCMTLMDISNLCMDIKKTNPKEYGLIEKWIDKDLMKIKDIINSRLDNLVKHYGKSTV